MPRRQPLSEGTEGQFQTVLDKAVQNSKLTNPHKVVLQKRSLGTHSKAQGVIDSSGCWLKCGTCGREAHPQRMAVSLAASRHPTRRLNLERVTALLSQSAEEAAQERGALLEETKHVQMKEGANTRAGGYEHILI